MIEKIIKKENTRKKIDFEVRQKLTSLSDPKKPKEKLNIHFKFNDSINEERDDEVLFRVFDILLSSQKEKKRSKKVKKNNENNGNTNCADKT